MATRILFPVPPVFLDLTLQSVPVVIAVYATILQLSDYILSGSLFRAANLAPCCDTFDFMVVGGGSAGAAVAARLSEDPKIRVLLLEAGADPDPVSYLPALAVNLQGNPQVDWEYKTVPQNGSAFSAINQEVFWPRGKSLGGSSNLNFMIYLRGNRHDYDRWAEVTGDPNWRYENVENVFSRIEDYYGVWEEEGYHSQGGPLRVENVQYSPGINYLLDAATELGYETRDMNRDQRQGFTPLDFTQKRGFRFSTFRAYIKPNKDRQNLVIFRYSLATKIHFDDELRAIGVSFLRHGIKGYAQANKEVIVCSGAVNSPHLLMLSGIGPRNHLAEHRIPPIVDLPVGLNLQDHVTAIIGPFLLDESARASYQFHRDTDVGAFFDLFFKGTGPLTSPLGIMAVGFTSTSQASPNWPDIFLTVTSLGIFRGLGGLIDEKFNTGNTLSTFLAPDVGRDSHFVLVSLGLPKSTGYIKLRDSNPLSKPIINPRYFSDPDNHDLQAMIDGVSFALNLYENTTSFRRINAHLSRSFPGCENTVFKSREYIECLVRTLTLTLYHPTSTCRMGRLGDMNSVVDSRLRVFGVKGLRVADASIMPFVTNANTNAPSILIGNMCADFIKGDWGLRSPSG